MAGYKELVDEYRFNQTETELSGTRAFYPLTGGASSLPVIGDEFYDYVEGETIANCNLRSIEHGIYFPDPSDRSKWKKKYVCNYSTKPRGGGMIRSTDLDERRFQMGGEILTIPWSDDEESPSWKWQDEAALKQPLSLSNIMGSFTRTVVFNSDSEKDTWLKAHLETKGGTINDAEFEGFREGAVLFSSFSGGTQYDDQGDKIWVFELEFSYRIIRAAGGWDASGNAITKDDWLYIWRKEISYSGAGAWDKPKDGNTPANNIFAKTHFDDMF